MREKAIPGKVGWPGVFLLGLAGCVTIQPDHPCADVPGEVRGRTGTAPVVDVPPGAILGVDDAIGIALANNKAFQATLDQLGMAHGDRVQAGLLPNPFFNTFLFPIDVKQWEWTLLVPIDALILRPRRLGLTESEYQRIAHQLVQNGLDLVRDVRLAYTDLDRAIEQARLADEAVVVRRRIAELTAKRLAAGDISALEATTARIDVLQAEAAAGALAQDVLAARSRFVSLIGLPFHKPGIQSDSGTEPILPEGDVNALVAQALAGRPDMVAAEWAVESAARRARLSRWPFRLLAGGVDANGRGLKGFEIGPALQFDIPLFDRNQGGILRAAAEYDQAIHRRDALHDQIVDEVRTAWAQMRQAREQLAILRERILPALQQAIAVAEKGYADGGTDYFLVLQTTQQYLGARAQLLDQRAALRRAHAQVERAVGHRLSPPNVPLLEVQP